MMRRNASAAPKTGLWKTVSKTSQVVYPPVYLRRDAQTPAFAQRIGVGGNGATIQTGDPEGRERSLTGHINV